MRGSIAPKNKHHNTSKAYLCVILCAALLFGFLGCSQVIEVGPSSAASPTVTANPTAPDLNELAKSEVREYQGENLSSINDITNEAIKGTQYIDINSYRLKVDGLVDEPTDLTYDDVLKNTRYTKVVTLNCVGGWSAQILWEGILLKDIFDKVKVKSNANTVIFYAADGFSTALPLKTVLDKNMIIAYKINNLVLPVQMGYPFELVAEDKLGYKWIKWLTHIELSDKSDYLGTWESEGFSNEANVKK